MYQSVISGDPANEKDANEKVETPQSPAAAPSSDERSVPPLHSPLSDAQPSGAEEPDLKQPEPKNDIPGSDKPGLQANIASASAEEMNFAQEIKNEIKNYYLSGDSATTIRSFSVNDAWRISETKEEEIAQLYVADQAEIQQLLKKLNEKRLLVLSGHPGTGKATTAIYLGKQLAEQVSGDGAVEITKETYLIPSLDRQVRIDLRELSTNSQDFSHRLVIFKDAFASRNRELLGFFDRMSQYSLQELSDNLRRNQSFLIFTTAVSEIKQFQPSLVAQDVQHELTPLNQELLAYGLNRKLDSLKQHTKISDALLQRLQQEQHLLLARLETMPRVARFVEYYLFSLAPAEADLSLDDAIRHFEDITHWFCNDLSRDFEAWCFAFSLGLAQCLPDSPGITWFHFERLRRVVAQSLKRDPELFPQHHDPGGTRPKDAPEKGPILTDDPYLERCRAEVIKDPHTLADTIRFRDKSYPHKLWEIFLKHHRRVLGVILPELYAMVEDHTENFDPYQGVLAAQIIGRIGEIDPDRVAFAAMDRWTQSGDRRRRASIGTLYQGVMASADKHYRAYCLKRLKAFMTSAGDGIKGYEKDRLLTAIAAYSQLGVYDLLLAMQELERIAERYLAPVLLDNQRIARLLKRVEDKFAESSSADEALSLSIYHALLSELAYRLYSERGGAFLGVQYGFFSLCLSVDPVQVCNELRRWISASGHTTGALVALMFFQDDGIASMLEAVQIEMPTDSLASNDAVTYGNPLLISLAANQESVRQMARFLVVIFESFSTTFTFRVELQRSFRESFLQRLKGWVKTAIPAASCRTAMEDLFLEMFRIHNRVLFDPLFQLLHDRDFSQDAGLKAFADAVITRHLQAKHKLKELPDADA